MPRFRARNTTRRAIFVSGSALAVALLLVAVMHSHETAMQARCADHLRALGLGFLNYYSSNEILPLGLESGNLPPERRLGWRSRIVDFIEVRPRGPQFDRAVAWDSSKNIGVAVDEWRGINKDGKPYTASLRRGICFDCPAYKDDEDLKRPAPSPFVGIAGHGVDSATLKNGDPRAGVFGYDRQTKWGDITDGLADTMMIAETTHDVGPWTAGGKASLRGLDPDHPPYVGGKKGQFGGLHPGGANVLMADGSVKFVRSMIDPRTFEALSTIAGGEPTPGW